MSVETRFVVIRNNEEVKTFMDKKSADEYDKMLEIADGISELLSESPITINDNDKETLSIFFAQKRDGLLIALQAKKAKPAPKIVNKPVLEEAIDEGLTVEEECAA
tara:strand:- start:120 stop:437 length:318 start_codon:yes stop_codon:yes gene_type:complete